MVGDEGGVGGEVGFPERTHPGEATGGGELDDGVLDVGEGEEDAGLVDRRCIRIVAPRRQVDVLAEDEDRFLLHDPAELAVHRVLQCTVPREALSQQAGRPSLVRHVRGCREVQCPPLRLIGPLGEGLLLPSLHPPRLEMLAVCVIRFRQRPLDLAAPVPADPLPVNVDVDVEIEAALGVSG